MEEIIARYYTIIDNIPKEQIEYLDALMKVKQLLKKENITSEELRTIIISIEYLERAQQDFKESKLRWHK